MISFCFLLEGWGLSNQTHRYWWQRSVCFWKWQDIRGLHGSWMWPVSLPSIYRSIQNRLPPRTKERSHAWTARSKVQIRRRRRVKRVLDHPNACNVRRDETRCYPPPPPNDNQAASQLHLWRKKQLVEKNLFLLSVRLSWNKSRKEWWLLIIVLSETTLKYEDRWCYLY